MLQDIIRQLKLLRHGDANPSQEWLEKNRATLLAQIKNTVPTRQNIPARSKAVLFDNVWSGLSIFLPRPLVYNVVRPLAVLLIVALVGTSGWIASVDAAYQAQPGDFSYSVLRTAQKTQAAVVGLMGDANGETKLHLQFAASIAAKTKQLAQTDQPQKNAKLAVAVADLNSELSSINSNLSGSNGASGVQATVVKDVKQNSDQIKNVLTDVKNNLLTSTGTPDASLTQAVNSTKDLVKDVSVKAVEVMVNKLNAGDKSVSESEVKQSLDNSLQSAVSDVQDAKQTVEVVNSSVDTVKSELTVLPDKGDATTTAHIATQVQNIASSTKQAAAEASAASVSANQTAAAASSLLSSASSTSDLSQVVDAIKEVNQVSKTAEKLSDNTLQTVQTVLPISGIIKDDSSAGDANQSTGAATSTAGVDDSSTSTVESAAASAPTSSSKSAQN